MRINGFNGMSILFSRQRLNDLSMHLLFPPPFDPCPAAFKGARKATFTLPRWGGGHPEQPTVSKRLLCTWRRTSTWPRCGPRLRGFGCVRAGRARARTRVEWGLSSPRQGRCGVGQLDSQPTPGSVHGGMPASPQQRAGLAEQRPVHR
jgi:hypothetical protein